VTKQAYAMTSIYGLNERVGNISFYDSQGRDAFTKPYSEDTAKVIDEEVSKLIEGQYLRALDLLGENQDKLVQLADRLLSSEVIFKEDLEAIFGKRPWDPIEEVSTNEEAPTSEEVPTNEEASTNEEPTLALESADTATEATPEAGKENAEGAAQDEEPTANA